MELCFITNGKNLLNYYDYALIQPSFKLSYVAIGWTCLCMVSISGPWYVAMYSHLFYHRPVKRYDHITCLQPNACSYMQL